MFPASRNSLTRANILHGTDKCIFHWRTNLEGIWLYGLGEEDYTSAAVAVLLRQLHLSGVYRLTGGEPGNEFQTDSVWKRLIYSPIDRSSLY